MIGWAEIALERDPMNLLAQDTQPRSEAYCIILLNHGRFAKVDVEDYEQLRRFNWYASRAIHTRSYYAARHIKNPTPGKYRQKTLWMAREIIGAKPGEITDHRNRDTLDNRRSNLRLASNAENAGTQKSDSITAAVSRAFITGAN